MAERKRKAGTRTRKKATPAEAQADVKAEQADPVEAVNKLSELDLLRFLRMDTELHNHQLEVKNLEQAQKLEDIEYTDRRRERQNRLMALKSSIKVRSAEQMQLLKELAGKYGFDPSRTSIDDKTGAIQEHPVSTP